ncbi:hypothetical protein [uncultured Streptococcus sp.]|uniref:hypothetical protein n=1 Tax=uncultured Streptococcus sp. TaxID=83427 RepID=UPI0025FD2E29|nr:hypothetical protein [uncultured Streptococcus sp.]
MLRGNRTESKISEVEKVFKKAKRLLLIFSFIAISFSLFSCSGHSFSRKEVTEIKIGQTYETPGPIKILDEKHFVMLHNDAEFDTQEELDEYQTDNAPISVYPYIYFAEGVYEKVGDEYRFWVQRGVNVEFKNVANIKKKIISTRDFDNVPTAKDKYFSLAKKDGVYRVNGNQGVFTTYQEIPDSIDEFLAQYQYEPEELKR